MERLLSTRVPVAAPVRLVLLACAALAAGCAAAPVVPPPQPRAPVVTYEQKLGWILRLEDHRVLRDRRRAGPGGRAAGVAALPVADLVALLADADPRVRRRAALAIGRVGLKAGARPLEAALAADREPEVRQMAAFSLGLLRDPSAAPALRSALGDEMPIVQGRAAEALGLLGDAASAELIAGLVASIVAAGEVAAIAPDDVEETHAPAVEAFRLGVLALGRLKDYEALASAVLDQQSRPRVTWWPVAAAFQRVEDRRAAYVLTAFARGESRVGRAFAARGLGALKDPAAVETLVPLVRDWERDTRAAVAAARALGSIGDRKAGPALIDLLRTKGLDPLLRLEVIGALASTRAAGAFDVLLPLAQDPVPAVRAAALAGLRAVDPLSYTVMLSGLDPDPDWRVRSAIASSLSTLERDAAEPRPDGDAEGLGPARGAGGPFGARDDQGGAARSGAARVAGPSGRRDPERGRVRHRRAEAGGRRPRPHRRVPRRGPRRRLRCPYRRARRAGEVRSRGGGPRASRGAGRQGLGGARPRRRAPRADRPVRRSRRGDPARARRAASGRSTTNPS